MILPFITKAVVISEAQNSDDIIEKSKKLFNETESLFNKQQNITNEALNKLTEFELSIVDDFCEFERISEPLLNQLIHYQKSKNLQINIPTNNMVSTSYSIESIIEIFTIMRPGLRKIFDISKVIANGITYISYSSASKKLAEAEEYRNQVQKAVDKMILSHSHLKETENYINRVYKEVNRIYQIFKQYLQDLKKMDTLLRDGVNINTISSDLVYTIGNGRVLSEILTAIITTPLFKVKKDSKGELVKNSEGMIEFEKDNDGMQIINKEEIDASITDCQHITQNVLKLN